MKSSNQLTEESVSTSAKNKKDVLNYYDTCWLNRFADGHNPKSFAMHFGIFQNGETDNDAAKLETNKYLANALDIKADEASVVIDMGCGIGGTCLYLGQSYPKARITGVNISATQLAVAQRLIEENDLSDRVNFTTQDYCNTDLENNLASQAFAVESLWHASDKRAVFKEACRLLQKDGVFVVIDYFQTREVETEEEIRLLREFNIGWGAYEDGTGPVKNFDYNFLSDMKEIGFSTTEFESLLSKVKKGIENSNVKALKNLSDGVESDDLERHYKACVALNILTDRGIVDYGIIKAVV